MGEFALYQGERVKIGTCESMYYLRADQAHLVRALEGNVDPVADQAEIRFRFPFPDEDHVLPGAGGFDDFQRGEWIPNWTLPADWSGHYSIQFKHELGYLLSIPCPESAAVGGFSEKVALEDGGALQVHRNGFNARKAGAQVLQQRWVDGDLVTVISCGACGSAWRLATLADAEPVAVAFRAEADRTERQRTDVVFPPGGDYPKVGSYTDSPTYEWLPANGEDRRAYLHAMADRILAGYTSSVAEQVTA